MEYVRVNYTHENMNSAYILDDYKTILKNMRTQGYVFESTIPQTTLASGKVIRADLAFSKKESENVAFEEVTTSKAGINNRELDEELYKKLIQEKENLNFFFAGYIPLSYTPNGQVNKLALIFYKY